MFGRNIPEMWLLVRHASGDETLWHSSSDGFHTALKVNASERFRNAVEPRGAVEDAKDIIVSQLRQLNPAVRLRAVELLPLLITVAKADNRPYDPPEKKSHGCKPQSIWSKWTIR
jgi:hypothetical protein